jgi:hypothetical protein
VSSTYSQTTSQSQLLDILKYLVECDLEKQNYVVNFEIKLCLEDLDIFAENISEIFEESKSDDSDIRRE